MLCRCGTEAAAGRASQAAGVAAGALGYLDMLYTLGDIEMSWRSTLEEDPVIVQRTPTLAKSHGVPEPAGAGAKAGGATTHRLKFSQLIEPEILESTLETGKQWAQWEALTRA
jgi:hypothetical protein